MKRILFFFILSAVVVQASTPEEKTAVPNIKLKYINGNKGDLQDILKDGPVLIDFWASWCKPCLKGMKFLDIYHQKYAEQGLTVLSINQDTPKSLSKVKSIVRSRKFSFPVALDPNKQIKEKLNARLLPTTILVNQKGEIVWRHQGYMPGDEKEIEHQIRQVLGLGELESE